MIMMSVEVARHHRPARENPFTVTHYIEVKQNAWKKYPAARSGCSWMRCYIEVIAPNESARELVDAYLAHSGGAHSTYRCRRQVIIDSQLLAYIKLGRLEIHRSFEIGHLVP
jgi:hypothetical protein